MNMDEEEYSAYGYGSGCGIHGEDFLAECTMCGIEFCTACFPRSALCADCAAQTEFDDDEDLDPENDEANLLLLEDFNDDEPREPIEEKPDPPLKKTGKTKAKPGSKAKTKAKGKTKPKAKPKAKVKSKARAATSPAKKRKA